MLQEFVRFTVGRCSSHRVAAAMAAPTCPVFLQMQATAKVHAALKAHGHKDEAGPRRHSRDRLYTYIIHICNYISLPLSLSLYIYIYIYVGVHIYVYIYIYINK